MRIAIYHNLPSGGAKRALYEWTRRLATSHSVDAFTLSTADHAFCDIRPSVRRHHVLDFAPRRLFGSPWGRLNRLQRWRDLGELTRIGRQIAREIDAGGYDVLFAHPCLYTFIPVFLRFVQIPAVYFMHEPFGPNSERDFQRPYIKERRRWRDISRHLDPLFLLYTRRLENARIKSIKRTACMLANSQFTRRCMKSEYGVQAPVCYYGVDLEGFRPIPGIEKESFVLSVGELTPRKGFDFLIESLAHIPSEKRPPLKVVSNWSSPEERQYLEELAARCDVDLHIHMNLNTHQLALEYNKALICVYAPVSEAFGLVPLESMACGTPVIGVAEGGVCETVLHGETGILTHRDSRCFAHAIEKLLRDANCRKQLGHQGRVYVEEKWQWGRSVLELERHLLSVLH